VDLGDIQYVRLVDIPGNGAYSDEATSLIDPTTGLAYTADHGILDNWMTVGTGGFDFRLPAGLGVGVINQVPEPMTVALLGLGGLLIRGRRK
jgi:hypothetical protein